MKTVTIIRSVAYGLIGLWAALIVYHLATGGDQAAVDVNPPAQQQSNLRATLREQMEARGAYRVHYQGTSSREWGTMCKLPGGGFFTVAHVSDNGIPVVGPDQGVTATNGPSDWAFVGVDPEGLRAEDFPAMRAGQEVTILGYPARDRDGEEIPGRVYISDGTPPFVWIELLDAAGSVPAEGVVGGISGSCVLDGEGNILASVHANGFSKIEGTTNTWALVVPIRSAIAEAQGAEPQAGLPSGFGLTGAQVPSVHGWRE